MNAGNPKEWLVPMLRVWRSQWLRIYGEGRIAPDGWPTATVVGTIHSEGARIEFPSELYTDEGLLVSRAMNGMPISPCEVLHAKWLAAEPVKVQVQILRLRTTTYWALLDNAYYYLAGRIQRTDA